MSADLFCPPTETWISLSPRYLTQRRLGAVIGWGLLAAVAAVPLWIIGAPTIICLVVTAVGIAVIIWRLIRQPVIFRAWGFAERDTDLYIRSGVWIQRMTVVPYGRMQAVEVEAGPLQRIFKVASVKLVTASAQSDAVIPGLDPGDAARLRDRLTERGETQAAGL